MIGLSIGSVFAGIGGLELELGLEAAGIGRTVWQIERDAGCRDVLARHWPDAQRFGDVREVCAADLARVDLMCGGFPCQDISSASITKGEGLNGAKSSMYFQMERLIDDLRPTVVVLENSGRGWRSWVPVVRRRLWSRGYSSVPLRLRADRLGASHGRDRCFVVAYTHRDGEPCKPFDDEVARLQAVRRTGWTAEHAPVDLDDGFSSRMADLRKLGNAVMPYMAEVVGRVIVAHGWAYAAS